MPGLGLIIWTALSFILLGVFVYAIYHLAKNKMISDTERLKWLGLMVLIPFVGAFVYLGSRRAKNTNTPV